MAYYQDSLQISTYDSSGNIQQEIEVSPQNNRLQTTIPESTKIAPEQGINTSLGKKTEQVSDVPQDKSTKDNTYRPFTLYSTLQEHDSSYILLDQELPSGYKTSVAKPFTGSKPINSNNVLEKGWILGIALFSLIVILIVKIYFQKYLSIIITSIVNIQIAEKLMREKNVLIRRVFALLNLNFTISISLFFYLLLNRFQITILTERNFLTFLIIFGVIVLILSTRYILIMIIGSTFDSPRLFKEYLHNTYLINKNLGLYLLPLTISIFFLEAPLHNIAFYLSMLIVAMSLVYKYLRGLQILLRYNVFLFYSILYLCTLEIIPAIIGIKFALSLR